MDENTAEKIIDSFLAGYDPHLIAGDFGLQTEDVYDILRQALRSQIATALRPTRRKRKAT